MGAIKIDPKDFTPSQGGTSIQPHEFTPSGAVGYATDMTRQTVGAMQSQGFIPSQKDANQVLQDVLKEQLGTEKDLEKEVNKRKLWTDEDRTKIDSITDAADQLDKISKQYDRAHEAGGGWWGHPLLGYLMGGPNGDVLAGGGQLFYQHPEIQRYNSLLATSKPILNAGIEKESKTNMGSKYNQMIERLPTGVDSPESKNEILMNGWEILQRRAQAYKDGFSTIGRDMNGFEKVNPKFETVRTMDFGPVKSRPENDLPLPQASKDADAILQRNLSPSPSPSSSPSPTPPQATGVNQPTSGTDEVWQRIFG